MRTIANCLCSGRRLLRFTPLLTPGGSKLIEQFRVGDAILSRSEFDPTGPIEAKVIEEVFVRTGRVAHLHAGGEVIGTTLEHPFFEADRGWVQANELRPGDRIATLSGEWVRVEEVYDTGEWAVVYNLRIADHHTYFVGNEEWGVRDLGTQCVRSTRKGRYNRPSVPLHLGALQVPDAHFAYRNWPFSFII